MQRQIFNKFAPLTQTQPHDLSAVKPSWKMYPSATNDRRKRMSSVGFDSQAFTPMEHLYARLKVSM
ncbi:hypothetical protein B6D51_30575 [Pseudomonas chlororaphis subsp. chlororaphis]|nr:hypothetical protein B6D51_30575 [Pseudomonas chlororaphis subsp. chlororaphis]